MKSNFLPLLITITLIAFPALCFGQEMPIGMDSAIKQDNPKRLQKLLKGTDINKCYHSSYTILGQVIRMKAIKCFDLIINDKGINIDKNCNYKPAIFLVCKYGSIDMFRKLVNKGATISAVFEGRTLLQYAEKYNHEPIIAYLKSLKKEQ